LSIATCGLETISITNGTLEFTHEYILGSSVEGTNTSWLIYSTDFESNFVSSNPILCPLYLFDLKEEITKDTNDVVTSTTDNTNTQLSVVPWGTNSNFNVFIETTSSFNLTTYYLRASTQSTFDTVANNAFIMLNLQVVNCSEQNITIIGELFELELYQYSTTVLSTSVVELFDSSHPTLCPITSYKVQKVEN